MGSAASWGRSLQGHLPCASRRPRPALGSAMPSPNVECSAELNNKFVMLNLIRKNVFLCQASEVPGSELGK